MTTLFLTPEEAAELLRTSKGAIYQRIYRGLLPEARKEHGRWLIQRAPLLARIGVDPEPKNLASSYRSRGSRETRTMKRKPEKAYANRYKLRTLPRSKRGAKFEADVYVGGRRVIRRYCPHRTKVEAERWARDLLVEFENLEAESSETTPASVTLDEACQRWLNTQEKDTTNKASHLEWIKRVWGPETMLDTLNHEMVIGLPKKLMEPLGPTAKPRSIERRQIGNGRRRKKGTGIGDGRRRAVCQTANRLLRFSRQMHWLPLTSRVPLPTVPIGDADWLQPDELSALLATAGRWQLPWMLGARAGLRLGEILELRWRDVDWNTEQLRVARTWAYDQQAKSWYIKPFPKGRKPRSVPLVPTFGTCWTRPRGNLRSSSYRTSTAIV